MIDVVFLLLIFFIATLKPQDLLAKLDVSRPAPDKSVTIDIPILRIEIGKEAYVINGRQFPLPTIKSHLAKIYKDSPRTTLTIACTKESSHSQLIKLLDTCAELKITNVALLSL